MTSPADVEGLVGRLGRLAANCLYDESLSAAEASTLTEAAEALTAQQAQIAELTRERDEALADRDDFRDRLHDLVMIDAEEWALNGGGPGIKERRERAWNRAREPFEP